MCVWSLFLTQRESKTIIQINNKIFHSEIFNLKINTT